jgi:hypothetical protein
VEHVTTHQAQAEELLRAMNLLMDDVASYKSAVALLAVHSAIAFNDAVLERLTGSAYKGQDHSEAARKTRAACGKKTINGKKIDASGIQHLERLVDKKTLYSYSGIVDASSAQDAAMKATRFADWAYRTTLQRESSNG